MTRQEQANFVGDLCDSIKKEIIKNIVAEKVPEDWDGLEFRWLLLNKVRYNAFTHQRYSQRKRKFNNTVLVNNL